MTPGNRVHIIGASGYAAGELIRLLAQHPALAIGVLESHSSEGEPVGSAFPLLRREAHRFAGAGAVAAAAQPGDFVAFCAAHGVAKAGAGAFLERGVRVIDFSSDFRVAGSGAVYGFPERYRDSIAGAALIANPGCYPTASLLGTLPLRHLGRPIQIVIDAKSGITGAGRTPALGSLYAELAGDVRAYGLDQHRHEPEIAQEFQAGGISAPFVFTPHVVPLRRGMLACIYALYPGPVDRSALAAAFAREYAGNPFVHILPETQAPNLTALCGTNDAEIALHAKGNVARVLVGIDNLGKGAAGQAVQSLNIMSGNPQETGLENRALAV